MQMCKKIGKKYALLNKIWTESTFMYAIIA